MEIIRYCQDTEAMADSTGSILFVIVRDDPEELDTYVFEVWEQTQNHDEPDQGTVITGTREEMIKQFDDWRNQTGDWDRNA